METLEILYLMSLLISMNMIRIEYTHTLVPVIAVSAFLCDVMFILHLVKDAVTTLNFSDFRHASPFSGITMVNQQYILR